MLVHVVNKILKDYHETVPIILRIDAEFYDEKMFETCKQLHIGYLCGDKHYSNVIDWHLLRKIDNARKSQCIQTSSASSDRGRKKGEQSSAHSCRKMDSMCWKGGQCRGTLIITNLDIAEPIDKQLRAIDQEQWLEVGMLLALYHCRGTNELTNLELWPFKRFTANAAWYCIMVLGNDLF